MMSSDRPAGEALAVLALEFVDLRGRDLLEGRLHRLAGLDLGRVDEERVRAVRPGPVHNVAEDLEVAAHRWSGVVLARPPARDPIEHDFADVRVLADDDEDGWRALAGGLPGLEALLVVAVETDQGRFQRLVQDGFASELLGGPALLRRPVAYSRPQVAVRGRVSGHRVVRDRDAWDLHDPGLDRVDQAEVRDDPREQRSLAESGAAQEEWRGGEVVDRPDADLAGDGPEAVEPDAGVLLILGRVGALFRQQRLLLGLGRALVAVVGLVVEDDDVALVAKRPADAADHLFGRFLEGVGVAVRPGEHLLRKRGCLERVVAQEGVEVGDLDPGGLEGL